MNELRCDQSAPYAAPRLEPSSAKRGPQGRYNPGEAIGNILCNQCAGGGGD